MAQKKDTGQSAPPPPEHDPYKMRSLEQILSLFDGGDFLVGIMDEHADLLQQMLDHAEKHRKGAKGSMSIQVNYAMNAAGDVSMTATKQFTPPKEPAASTTGFVTDQGELTLYSPMMRQMHTAPRDVTPHDPETGEVRDI